MVLRNCDYTIAWISALAIEVASAQAVLDEEHEDLPMDHFDNNAYSFGRIGKHNVVIAALPSGTLGTTAAATVATNLRRSFPNIRFGLMVGVGGGVPSSVRLGDVVVSNPSGQTGGVVQYDFGTNTPDGFTRKGVLSKPPSALSTSVTKLEALALRKGYRLQSYHEQMIRENPRMRHWKRPEVDVLYEPSYKHLGSAANCSLCDPARIMRREQKCESFVHYGLIGSASTVLRDPIMRDKLHEKEGIICFEMEAAGLMNDFPCLVIRGICDYCDTHKNKDWQPYAASIAACYAKELLMTVSVQEVNATPRSVMTGATICNTTFGPSHGGKVVQIGYNTGIINQGIYGESKAQCRENGWPEFVFSS